MAYSGKSDIFDENGKVKSDLLPASGSISDEAYGTSWNTDTTGGASRHALYQKIETLGGSGLTQPQILARISMGF